MTPRSEFVLALSLPFLALVACRAAAPADAGSEAQGAVPATTLSGWVRDVSGVVMDYDSALPEIGSALLVRSRASEHAIAWEGETVPAGGGERVAFTWLFGLDVDVERHEFELSVDGRPWLRFATPTRSALEPWSVDGGAGRILRFVPTRLDRHGDVFGFAVLEAPRASFALGRTPRFEVHGDDSESPIWYMTFRGAPRTGARLVSRAAVLRDGSRRVQPLALELVHLGAPAEATIECDFAPVRTVELALGANRVELPHPAVAEPTEVRVLARVEGGPRYELATRLEPVRPWTIHLVQHTHTDIGYTRPQTEILADQLRYLDYALDYCDLTDDYPDEARFRWTCESAWAVAEYARVRPREQLERLRRRVQEGRIEPTALFANLSELLDERSCAASLEPLRALRTGTLPLGTLPVTTAMQDDVNGIAWSFVDPLVELGVRYLVMGQHGHRARIPFDVPTAFWWESRSGKRLLAFRADHYMTGNFLGLHSGRFESVEPPLFHYLGELERRGYPYERVAVQYSGVLLDNAPPGIVVCDFVRRWNERYEWPRLESSTASEFPRWVERAHGTQLPVLRVAWPDWWSDGIGSAPREAAAARRTQAELTAVEGLLSLARLAGDPLPDDVLRRVADARERLVFYGEHTYGAAESVSDPGAANSQVQWAEKAAYVWDAVKETARAKEAALGLLQAHLARAEVPTVAVLNTLSWPRSGIARVWIDRELAPEGQRVAFVAPDGRAAPAQRLERSAEGGWWALHVERVPALGWRSYRIEVGGEVAESPVAERAAGDAGDALVLESPFYRLAVERSTGALASLFDRELGRELVDRAAPHGLGQLVHEELGNRAQLERFGLSDFRRETAAIASVERGATGPIFESLIVRGSLPSCPGPNGFELEVRLHRTQKLVELCYRLRKRPNVAPEALYAAFPFALRDARVRVELAGAEVDVERELLEGTATDWHAPQGYVALEDAAARVLWSSPDVPLVQLGGLNLGRFQRTARVERPALHAWLFNNYWVTNFLATSEGELRFEQALTSSAPGSRASAARFGLERRVPFAARVLPAARPGSSLEGGSLEGRALLTLAPEHVILIGARPEPSGGVILHLRESEGRAAELRLEREGVPVPCERVTVLGEPLAAPEPALELAPFETCFVRLR